MLDNYIRADSVIDCVSDAKVDLVVNNALEKLRERLDREMPDHIGIVWKSIAGIVHERVSETIAERIGAGIADIIDDAVMRAGAEGEDPHLTDLVDLDDANGRELGAKIAEESYDTRVKFFRGLLDGLTPDALTDIQAEIVRS